MAKITIFRSDLIMSTNAKYHSDYFIDIFCNLHLPSPWCVRRWTLYENDADVNEYYFDEFKAPFIFCFSMNKETFKHTKISLGLSFYKIMYRHSATTGKLTSVHSSARLPLRTILQCTVRVSLTQNTQGFQFWLLGLLYCPSNLIWCLKHHYKPLFAVK